MLSRGRDLGHPGNSSSVLGCKRGSVVVQCPEERPAGLQRPNRDLDLAAAESVAHKHASTKHLLGWTHPLSSGVVVLKCDVVCRGGSAGLRGGLPGPLHTIRDLRRGAVLHPVPRPLHGRCQQVLQPLNVCAVTRAGPPDVRPHRNLVFPSGTLGPARGSTGGLTAPSSSTRTSALEKLVPGSTSPLTRR